MNDSPQAEWGVASMACVYAAASSFTVVLLWSKASSMQYPPPPASYKLSWGRWAVLALVWLLMVLVMSFPSFMYALSQTIPGGQNTLNISIGVMEVFRYSVGPLVSVINTVLVPYGARWVAKKDPNKATALILVARLMTSVLVPVTCLQSNYHQSN